MRTVFIVSNLRPSAFICGSFRLRVLRASVVQKSKIMSTAHVGIRKQDIAHDERQDYLWTLNFGPQHPATHTTLRIVMKREGERVVYAFDLETGAQMWKQALPAAPIAWGLAVDCTGQMIVSLIDGRVVDGNGRPRIQARVSE